jgi:hypothetical protein
MLRQKQVAALTLCSLAALLVKALRLFTQRFGESNSPVEKARVKVSVLPRIKAPVRAVF